MLTTLLECQDRIYLAFISKSLSFFLLRRNIVVIFRLVHTLKMHFYHPQLYQEGKNVILPTTQRICAVGIGERQPVVSEATLLLLWQDAAVDL